MLWLKRIFIALLLAAAPILILETGTRSVIEPASMAWIGALFLTFCAALTALALVGSRLTGGIVLQTLAGLAYGAFVVFHLRELTAYPPSTIGLALGALIVGVMTTLLLRFSCGRKLHRAATTRAEQTMPAPKVVGWRWLGITTILAIVLPIALYASGGKQRWHLLHQTKVFGSPVFKILGAAPRAQEAALLTKNAVPGAATASDIANRYAPAATPFDADSEAPSIVFVLLDTLRADAFTQFGGSADLMPKLARTFERCQRFTDVLANSSWTLPSIASMYTGLLPEHHGARAVFDPLEEGHTTFVEVLQQAGYETIGLQSNPTAGTSSGLGQGFDEFTEIERDPYPRAEVMNKAVLSTLGARRNPASATASQEPPLFLYLQYLDPHEPYLAGQKPNGWSAGSYREAYAAELAYLDEQLDIVLPQIRTQLGAETLFFFVSDHGEEFFEHDLFGHGHTLYREVIDIPAALCGGPFADGTIEARLEGRDVFSLMLGLANGSLQSNTDLVHWSRTNHRAQRYSSLSFQGFGNLQLRPYLQSVFQRALESKDGKWIWNAYGNTWEHYSSGDFLETRNLARRSIEPPQKELEDMTPAPWYRAEPIALDEAQRARMKTLGYIQ